MSMDFDIYMSLDGECRDVPQPFAPTMIVRGKLHLICLYMDV